VKFKIDENLPVELAQILRAAGHDAATVIEQGMGGTDDLSLARACEREGRVLVTMDLGFGDIRAYPPERLPGLMVLSVRQQDKAHVLGVFQRAARLLPKERIEGRLWIIEEARVRIRGEGRE